MIKRAAAVIATLGALGAGVLTAAPSASADSWNDSCRSWELDSSGHSIGWVGEPDGVALDACWGFAGNDPADIYARIGYSTNGYGIDACAQLVNVANGAWAHDYKCIGWSGDHQGQTYSDWLNSWTDVPAGTYVVQVGFWVNTGGGNQYLGNVQSPQIRI